jgi:ABC-type ATPase involved in cell division
MALQQLGINANKPFFMIIAGKSGSGKSHFLRFLMKEINIHQPFDYSIDPIKAKPIRGLW